MSKQTKAGFKKELLAYFRTSTFLTIALVMVGVAILTPLLIVGMGTFMDSMSDLYEEMGTDVSGMTEALSESASIGVQSAMETVSGVGLIVMLITLNKFAGGEQKKRSIIIPRSAGLRSFSYVFPKFIIYPLSALLLSIAAAFAAWLVSIPLFENNNLYADSVLLAGVLIGVTLMLYVCFHLALGTATGKAGMSCAVCITVSFLLPSILAQVIDGHMYNPFTMEYLINPVLNAKSLSGTMLQDIFVTMGFAIGIMILTFLVALFVQNAKRIDNSGDEIDL